MKRTIFTLFIVLVVIGVPHSASAATLLVEVDTGTETVNALEGVIELPETVSIHDISTGNSAILFWITEPTVEAGTITFAGITPGGFQGKQPLFIMEGAFSGVRSLTLKDVIVLRGDGLGETVPVTFSIRDISIEDAPTREDTAPPETFRPEIGRDDTVANGQWFIAFATDDKGLGVDRYEVKEFRQNVIGRLGAEWVSVQSPYALQDQELRSHIWVKAIDEAGNERIAKVAPRNPLPWYKQYLNWGIIGVGLFILMRAARTLWHKRLFPTA